MIWHLSIVVDDFGFGDDASWIGNEYTNAQVIVEPTKEGNAS